MLETVVVRLWKDVQAQEQRQWEQQTDPGWFQPDRSVVYAAKGKSVVTPGEHYAYSDFRTFGKPVENKIVPRIKMPTPLLDSALMSLTIQSPQAGPVWLTLDAEMSLYYWTKNVAPFDWSQPWELELDSSKVIQPVGDWVFSRLDSSTFHARIIGQIAARVFRALTDFNVRFAFRCGTATPKGQWLITSIRCEVVAGTVAAGLPIEGMGDQPTGLPPFPFPEMSEEENCAGEASGFVLVQPPSSGSP